MLTLTCHSSSYLSPLIASPSCEVHADQRHTSRLVDRHFTLLTGGWSKSNRYCNAPCVNLTAVFAPPNTPK
jgi:hypothetical protein